MLGPNRVSERTPEVLVQLMEASLGKRELDLLVVGGSVLDVYRGIWVEANVGIVAGRIVTLDERVPSAREVIDAAGRHVVPGFFDSHFHAGSCHLSPGQLAKSLLERGTTSTVCDFQEHYTVAGVEAVRQAIDEAVAAGLRIYYLVPMQQFVVRSLGVTGHRMVVEDMVGMLDWPETVAINEPPPEAVLSADPEDLRVISEALRKRLIYTGHAPEVEGPPLQAYLTTGPSSDHESRDPVAAWKKLGLGMKTIMRQGSAAPDLPRLVGLATEHPLATRHMSLGTDDVDPVDLSRFGHQDGKLRYAIAHGVDPAVAIQMATLNPAEYYRVDGEVGSLTPGRAADLVILDDLESVEIDLVIAGGAPLDRSGSPQTQSHAPARGSVRFGRDLRAQDFRLQAADGEHRVRVIRIEDESLLSTADEDQLVSVEGNLVAEPSRDLLKLAAVDRFTGSGQVGLGFIRGFGLNVGAVATTYQHPFFNVLVAGTADDAMALAANRLAEIGGGLAVVANDEVIKEWPLPLLGVFSEGDLESVRNEFEASNAAIRSLGCSLTTPILSLAFAALITIPEYGLTPAGLYDVAAGQIVSPILESSGQ